MAAKVIGSGRPHNTGGVKETAHGIFYQMRLPMLYIVRGLKQNKKFQLATEVKEAGHLDDLILSHEEDEIGFFQMKHKLNDNSKITEELLLSTKKDDYSISKYFDSYRKILKNKELRNDSKERRTIVIISTNIDIDSSALKNFEPIKPSKNVSGNKILSWGTEDEEIKSKYLFIKKDSQLYGKLDELLSIEEGEPSSELAKLLARVVLKYEEKITEFDQLFENHRDWFLENVFEVDKKDNETQDVVDVTFKDNFLSNNNRLNFRKAFSETYLSMKKTGKKDTTSLQEHLSGTKFQILKRSRRELVKIFLDILVFAVNQPNETMLGDLIEKEIGDYVGHTDRHSIACKFQLYIQEWVKQKDGRYLTNGDIERQFAVWGQETLNQIRMNDVKKYGCTFNNESNEVIVKLSSFLNTENDANVFCLYDRETLFSKIKVCQVLELFARENIDQQFIFCDIKDLIELENTTNCPVKAFTSQTCNTLFVSLQDCKLYNVEVRILRRLLRIIMQSKRNAEQPHTNKQRKRLIMSIHENYKSDFINEFCLNNYGIKYLSLDDFDNSFSELDEKSRRQLLEKYCIKLHGNYLKVVFSENDLAPYIRNEMLLKFISSELETSDVLLVANQYTKEVNQYYVNRSLVPVIVSQNITQDLRFHFVRGGTPQPDVKNQEVVVISNNDKLFEHFRKTNIDVHWLKETNDKYIWITSQGTLTNLRDYVSVHNSDPDPGPNNCILVTNVSDLENDVVLIKASPGMGKSILLSHLAEQSQKEDTSFFVVRTNLSSNCKQLDSLKNEENVTLKQAIHFVFITTQIESPQNEESQSAFNLLTVQEDGEDGSIAFSPDPRFGHMDHLRALVFCNLYNNEKIVLFLDGFDEIAPDYCKTTMNLLQRLKHSKVRKMWVTTRPHDITNDLEKNLETFAYTLAPLSEDDQLTFFEKFWGHKIKTQHTEMLSSLKDFFNSLNMSTLSAVEKAERKQNPNKRNSGFMSVPLHSYMLAKVLTNEFIQFCTQNNNDAPAFTPFTIFDLYSKFFNIKFEEILYKIDILAPQNTPFRDIKKNSETDHGKLALLEIFDDKVLPELVSEEDRIKLVNSVKTGKEKTGLVVEIVDYKPRFVHRTFAEYFAAHYLAKILLNPVEYNKKKAAKSLLYKSVTENSEYYYVLFTFFNYKVVSKSKNKDIFEAAIGGNFEKVLENANVNEMFDPLKRTPMHFIAMYFSDVFDNFVNGYKNLDLATSITKYNKDHLFIQRLEEAIIKRSSDILFAWTPTHYFAIYPFAPIDVNYSDLCQYLYDVAQDTLGRTPLMLVMLNHSSIQYLKGVSPLKLTGVNTQDHFQKTALHYALKKLKNSISLYERNSRVDNIHLLLEDLQIICFLLKHGARFDIPDNEGITSVDLINSVVTEKNKHILEELFNYEKLEIDRYDCNDIYLTSLNYFTQHVEKHGYHVFSFEVDKVVTSDHENVCDADRNFINKNHPCLQYLVERRKRRINSNIKPILIYTLLGELLRNYDLPDFCASLSNFVTCSILFNIPEKPELFIRITDLMALSTDNDGHKSMILFILLNEQIGTLLISKYPHLVDVVDSKGRTALHYAVIMRDSVCVTYLIQNNARADIADNRGELPAHINKFNMLNRRDTFNKKKLYFIEALPCEVASPLVWTMLFPILTQIDTDFIVYVLYKTKTIANILLSRYPDVVNTQDSEGKTALHYAVTRGDHDCFTYLIQNNARDDIPDNNGKTPAEIIQGTPFSLLNH